MGVGRSGPCNHVSGDEARTRFRAVLSDCLQEASHALTHEFRSLEFAAACLGFSGGAEDKETYSRELIRTRRLKVVNDAEIALTGATAGAPGIIVIAGTGSISFGRNAQAKTARAGGWGYIFGDEGGAFDITRRALRAALRWEEGWGQTTTLHRVLLDATQSKSANHLLHRFYADKERKAVAALAPLVTQEAERGDRLAMDILSEAAGALAKYVVGVHEMLFQESDIVTVAHIGGVFRSTPLRQAFIEALTDKVDCETVFPKFSPAAGALIEALRLDGNPAKLSAVPHTKT